MSHSEMTINTNLIDPNCNKFNGFIVQMDYEIKQQDKFIFVNWKSDFDETDKINLLKWFRTFGDPNYIYEITDTSLIGKRLSKNE